MKMRFEQAGTWSAIVAAIVCPVCFPKLALIGAALGLGVLAPYEGWFAAAAQVFLIVALLGHVVAYRRHRRWAIPALAAAGVVLVVGSLWVRYVEALVYLGLGLAVVATVWSAFALSRCATCGASSPATDGSPPAPCG